ncbi:MAG: response regulator, partial [Lentisphaeria bacterium]|nr:response regulator [Lentisphaeria bacterium]
NRQIMIMDDEDMIRGMLTLLLKRNKCDVTPACNGEEAIVAYKAAMETGNPIDLIIMDLTVPGAMGGKDCMEKILKIDPEAIAIVASGYSTAPVMADHSAYGFSGVLQKPYPIDDLLKEIDNLL